MDFLKLFSFNQNFSNYLSVIPPFDKEISRIPDTIDIRLGQMIHCLR